MLRRNLPTFMLAFIVFASLTMTTSLGQSASTEMTKLNHFVQQANSSDSAIRTFRLGRDLIEDGKWEDAEKRFRDFLRDYPTHKEAGAAIYWLAFTQKKQSHFSEADRLLVKLVNEYPKSSWVRDAKAMRLEIAPSLGNDELVAQAISASTPKAARPISNGQGPAIAPVAPVAQISPLTPMPEAPLAPSAVGIASGDGFTFITTAGQTTGTDEKDEIKAIALQSLMQSNPERALPYIGDILKNDSKASKGLKESAVRLLGQYRGPNSTSLLLDLARNQADPKLRRSAIYMLSNSDDDKVFDLLLELATKSTDPEVAKASLQALARHRNQRARDLIGNLASTAQSPLIRRDAIYLLGERNDDASVDRLIKIYDAESDPDLKKHAIFALSHSSNAKARQKLLEIARSNGNEEVRVQAIQWLDNRGDASLVDELVKLYQNDKSPKVRKQVIFSLSQMASRGAKFLVAPRAVGGQGIATTMPAIAVSSDGRPERNIAERAEKAVKALLSLYDGESDEAMKSQMLFAFSQSKARDTLQKLMQVAKNDPSLAMRKKAVVYLGQSNDPEASKFLEDILK